MFFFILIPMLWIELHNFEREEIIEFIISNTVSTRFHTQDQKKYFKKEQKNFILLKERENLSLN